MNLLILTFFLIFLRFSPLCADQFILTFKFEGKTIKELNKNELNEFAEIHEIAVFEPNELGEITFIGYDFNDLLKNIYGDNFSKDRDLLVKCADGYQPVIPAIKFTEYKSYLTYKIKYRHSFSVTSKNQGGENIDLGRYYLIWDNLGNRELLKQGSYDFPYQIMEFDLIKFHTRFPKMSPPDASSEKAKKGFMAFRRYCSACHSINGEGSDKSIELNYPVNITEYFDREWLSKWIKDPSSIRYNSRMPGLSVDLEERDRIINHIIDYLEVMKDNKITP